MKNIQWIIILLLIINKSIAQNFYLKDSLVVSFITRNNFVALNSNDLNFQVEFISKVSRKILTYPFLVNYYKSPFGNCYFELYSINPFDSSNSIKNITLEYLGNPHYPNEFKDGDNLLNYDINKTFLKGGQKRMLNFNLLDWLNSLYKGKYYFVFYLRISNTFGYDKEGKIITNSIHYLESKPNYFEVLNEVSKRRPLL